MERILFLKRIGAYFNVRYFDVRFVRETYPVIFSQSSYCYCIVLSLHCKIVSN